MKHNNQTLMRSDILKKLFQKFDEEKIKNENDYSTEIRKSIAETEEENGLICLHIINNDYSPLQNKNKIKWLFDVQRLFSIQLPKMPREYVVRIVFDRSHKNLIIYKKDKGVIAGICYRLFQEQGFAEIVFCAVTADEQVKGYGTHMMNHLKDYMVGKLGIFHLLTYADEFAIESFPNFGLQFEGLKQFFEKNGGQPLCLEQIKGTESLSNIEELKKIEEEHSKYQQTETLQKHFRLILQKLKEDKNSWPFRESVDVESVPDYHNIINFPIDLGIISQKFKNGYYTCGERIPDATEIDQYDDPLLDEQNSFGGFPQNPYEGGGFDQYSANNNIFAPTPLTDFAYQAGQTFYSGVRQASRLLGIDSGQYQQYEVPLLSQSARFFGKRK
uniref:Histone acetyltransferase n=1 Tax=Meloidogyne javanica TaxID=6303 RepID=A0A915MZ22_MELJA